jgi:hypothetical protein
MLKGVKKRKKVRKEKKSKGLSNIVATLLIVLISIVAIIIFWVVIRNIVINQSELAKIKNEFFSENIEIKKFNIAGDFVNLTLEKKGGLTTSNQDKEKIEVKEVINMDIISVVDLSESMRICVGSSEECCINTLGGYWEGEDYCGGVDLISKNSCVSICGGTLDDKIAASQKGNRELTEFILTQSEGSRIGLVGYGQDTAEFASIDLTNNITNLNNKIDSWDIVPYTCICCGINEAIKKFQEDAPDNKMKKMIVMSDGEANIECAEQNTGDPSLDAIKAACDSNKTLDNLIIYTVGIGNRVDQETLMEIANCGGGKYFSAMNVSELIEAYTTIGEYFKTTYQTITNVNYLFVVFSNGTDSYTEKIDRIPGALEIKTYQINFTNKLGGEVTKIEIFPVIITDSGKEIIGPPSDIWEK